MSHRLIAGYTNRITAFIRNLSANAEFCLVMLLCFGWIIGLSVWRLFASERLQFTNGRLARLVMVEVLLLSVVLWIGKIRGWSLKTFGDRISWKGTGGGILLFVVTYGAQIGVYEVAWAIHPELIPSPFPLPLAIPVIFLVSVINPVFEEVLEAGYFIQSLQRFGMWRVVLASALFRAILHMYQGLDGALDIFAFGIIFGLIYWGWRQLWPLIVAHALADFIGLWPHVAA